ncbi:hypothetical protein LTS18_013617 [Coniosporium uncinatum]|uniref:Uncharacterized protein n=1 Tax=Coniosporium uncinatum TaxID=93489 RepID=A0ACC3DVK5_9PEZI|nr:hypothetical protein LTS18_013617 [Coniosporium uncinatum]
MDRFLYAVASFASILCAMGLCGEQEVKKQRAKLEEQKAKEEIKMKKKAKRRESMKRRREHMRRAPSPDAESPRPRTTTGRSRENTVSHIPFIHRNAQGWFRPEDPRSSQPSVPTHVQSFSSVSPLNMPESGYSRRANQYDDDLSNSLRNGDYSRYVHPTASITRKDHHEYGPHGIPKGGFAPQPSMNWSGAHLSQSLRHAYTKNSGSPYAQPDTEQHVRFGMGQQI